MTGRDLPPGGSGPDGRDDEARHRDQLERVRRRRAQDLADRDRYAPQAPLIGASRRGRRGMAMGLAGGICVLAAAAGAAAVLAPRSPDPSPPALRVTSTPTGSASAGPVVTSPPPVTQGPPAAPAAPAATAPPPPPAGAGPGAAQAGPGGPVAGGPGRGRR